jgi:hypothetical protein
MIDIDDCRYLADQCLALAAKPELSEKRRKALLEMATTWDRLASELVDSRWRARRFLGGGSSAGRDGSHDVY